MVFKKFDFQQILKLSHMFPNLYLFHQSISLKKDNPKPHTSFPQSPQEIGHLLDLFKEIVLSP